ncbi:MAG: hypothetical protein KJP09_01840 [Bacteroidia bacterium]|nr:hypothetical protein [Bacteroidia bacterium]
MKKLLSLLTLCIVFVSCENENLVEEQSCDNRTFVGRVSLKTQGEVNDFGAMCYTKIDGVLQLIDTNETIDNILDLSPLSNLTEIFTETYPDSLFGTLRISTKLLTDLQGLNNLTSVSRLIVNDNESLVSLSGLESLQVIEGANFNNPTYNIGISELSIRENPVLQNLNGLNNLALIGNSGNVSYILIRNNPELLNIDGLENLTTVGTPDFPYGEVYGASPFLMWGNHQLQNLDGLGNLAEVYGRIALITFNSPVTSNNNLTDYCGLQNLLSNGYYDEITLGSSLTVQDIVDGNCIE